MYTLRLTNGCADSRSFAANGACLASRINAAFTAFSPAQTRSGVLLQVHHSKQGWHSVYNAAGTCIIFKNPIQLDFRDLNQAILTTLAQCNRWPDPDKAACAARAREREALRRRQGFQLIPGKPTPPI